MRRYPRRLLSVFLRKILIMNMCIVDFIMHCGIGDLSTGNILLIKLIVHVAPSVQKKIYLWFTGHSLGAGTATLAYAKMLFSGEQLDSRVTFCGAYTFGNPRTGNKKFCDRVQEKAEDTNTMLYRVVNANDIITMIPLAVFPKEPLEYSFLGKATYLSLFGPPKNAKGQYDFVFNFLQSYKELMGELLTLLSPFPQPAGARYNSLVRWLVPIMIYDHFPTQYIRHMNPTSESKET